MPTLHDYGTEAKLVASAFPSSLDPAYFEVWSQYITTQTAYDLFNSEPQPRGMIRVVQGFISSLAQYNAKIALRPVGSPLKETLQDLKVDTRKYWHEVTKWLDRNQFNQLFRLASVDTVLDVQKNIVANCINYTAKSYLTYVPRQRGTRTEPTGSILHTQKQFWFRGKEPASLFKTDNLTKKLMKSAHGIEYDTYPTLKSIMNQPKNWFEWNENLGVDIARIKGNAVVLSIESPRRICFLMRKKPQEVQRQIIKTIGSTLT